MKKCCDICIHKKVCDYWEKKAHPNDYGTYDGEPCMDYFPADVSPVVHGRWYDEDSFDFHGSPIYRCSICNKTVADNYISFHKFCLHCGARMDGGNE